MDVDHPRQADAPSAGPVRAWAGRAAEHRLVPYAAVRSIPAASVLVLAPHPDDEVLGCGGAILRHVGAGAPVRVVVATDGAFGLEGEARDRRTRLRIEESWAAARVLGYRRLDFWGEPDQSLAYGEPLVRRILAELGDADLVYAPSVLEMHPDHRALGMAAAEAVRRAGGGLRLAMYEVGAPLRPNLLLDISDVAEAKQAAARCFASQLAHQRYDLHAEALNRFRTYTLSPEVTAAEAFTLVTAEALQGDPLGLYRPEHERQRALGFAIDPRDAPLVSVVVRSMDRPELAEALGSIALQTWPNIEVVVVDACGDHRPTPPACGPFPVSFVGAGEPLGRSRAANLGLAHARGELVIFLDDDDLLLPDHLARLVEALRREPGRRAAYAGVRVDDGTGAVDLYDAEVTPARMLAWNHLPIHAVLFERSLAEEGCAFDEDLDLYEDWDFWLQVSRRTGLARAPGVSAVYRAHLGRSALTAGAAWEQFEARRRIWRKWLSAWDPADLEGLVNDFRRERDEDARRLAQAAFDEAALRAQLAESERSRAELLASTAWRITGPLRALAGRFRKR